MGPEKKIKYKDREVTATPLEFDSKVEGWSRYTLEDGTTMNMKVLLLDVLRIEGEYDDNGNPLYQFQAQYIAGIQAPENLKKKAT